jgi:hypothetical protein
VYSSLNRFLNTAGWNSLLVILERFLQEKTERVPRQVLLINLTVFLMKMHLEKTMNCENKESYVENVGQLT